MRKFMSMKNIYRNKKTGRIVLTSEKLGKLWDFIGKAKKKYWKNTSMKKNEVIKK